MATVITWDCKTVDCYTTSGSQTNVIYKVHWIVKAVSDTLDPDGYAYMDSSVGVQILDISDLNNFTPFDNLTHSDIISWTKSAMGSTQVSNVESEVQLKLQEQVSPSTITLTVSD
jgi:hypothetical protein